MKPILLALPLFALSACATAPSPLGAAIAHSKQVQAVAPTAEQKNNTFIPADRARQKHARDAYQKGEVKKLERLGTRK